MAEVLREKVADAEGVDAIKEEQFGIYIDAQRTEIAREAARTTYERGEQAAREVPREVARSIGSRLLRGAKLVLKLLN